MKPFLALTIGFAASSRLQWISAAGTRWAAMALSLSLPRQNDEPRLLLSATH